MNWTEALDAISMGAHEGEIALRLVLASAISAVIGYERETNGNAAGLRTHMLTSLAAAVFTILAFAIFIGHERNGDPIRIIEAVTQGVAFLAAGAIIQSRGRVHGLTTGASIWMAGALGVACGAGYYSLAVMAAIAAFLILRVLKWVETDDDTQPVRGDNPAAEGKSQQPASVASRSDKIR
jgi:putative Mg2+ transporter-C (MgtC) family protein